MRVVHVAESVAGGIASYFEEISGFQSALYGEGNVFYVVPQGSGRHLPSIAAGQLVHFTRGNRTPLALSRFGYAAMRAISRIDPQIVHLHSTFAGLVLRPLLGLTGRRAGVIYCPHGWAFGMEASNLRKFFYAEVERSLTGLCDLVIVNSAAERRLATHHGIAAAGTRTVTNGIGHEPGPIGGAAPGDRPETGPIAAAFVGRHDRQKGLDILLRAMARLPPDRLRLSVVGDSVLDLSRGQGGRLRTDVRFRGWLPRAEVFALLRRQDVVIMPSRWEAFGLVALEAMRAGVPVIVSDRGALPEIIRQGVDGYVVDIEAPDDLARLLARLDRAVLRRMGRSAQARFLAEFGAARMNQLLARHYDAVLARVESQRRLPLPAARTVEPQRQRGDAAAGLSRLGAKPGPGRGNAS